MAYFSISAEHIPHAPDVQIAHVRMQIVIYPLTINFIKIFSMHIKSTMLCQTIFLIRLKPGIRQAHPLTILNLIFLQLILLGKLLDEQKELDNNWQTLKNAYDARKQFCDLKDELLGQFHQLYFLLLSFLQH